MRDESMWRRYENVQEASESQNGGNGPTDIDILQGCGPDSEAIDLQRFQQQQFQGNQVVMLWPVLALRGGSSSLHLLNCFCQRAGFSRTRAAAEGLCLALARPLPSQMQQLQQKTLGQTLSNPLGLQSQAGLDSDFPTGGGSSNLGSGLNTNSLSG